MTLVGAKTKNGVVYSRYGCTAHWKRGAAICSNKQTFSENKITRALLGALTETLSHPDVIARFVDQAQRRIAGLEKKGARPDGDIDRRVRESEHRIANLTETLAKLGWSDAIAAKLKDEESALVRLKSERAKAAKAEPARALPHPRASRPTSRTSWASARRRDERPGAPRPLRGATRAHAPDEHARRRRSAW